MNQLRYTIKSDEAINRWRTTPMQMEPFHSPYETFDAEVNLGEGYVQIIYPVRQAFLKEDMIQKIERYEGPFEKVYFPFENNRVDYTTFIHEPHHLWVYGETFIEVEEEGEYPFELYTCGGMKIWVNGELLTTFAPYTRNIPQMNEIEILLKKGVNEIRVYADELAERDVFFYFELRYKGNEPIEGFVLIDEDPVEVFQIEDFLRSCYFEKDCLTEGELKVLYEPGKINKEMKITLAGDPTGEKLSDISRNGETLTVLVQKNQNFVSFGELTNFNVGVFNIALNINIGSLIVSRNLLIGVLPQENSSLKPMPTIEERKKQALTYYSSYGDNVVNKCIAILESEKVMTPLARACMENSLDKIIRKQDCADFYLVPMFLLLTKYKKYLTDSEYHEIKRAVLDFRYWIDEPGNDVMWYFSENHALLFHIAQYLSGSLFVDETFTVSSRKGQTQYEIGKDRLEKWFETFKTYGYAEWNSATYIPIDLIGFFVLYEIAPDKSIIALAKEALDFTFKIITYNTFNGIMSSSFGRSYEDTLKSREQVEPSFIEWVTSGKGFVSSRGRAVSLYCISDYIPPNYSTDILLKADEGMEMEFDQGAGKVKTYAYRTNQFFMGCVRRYKPFAHGHQQHLMNVALGEKSIQFYINHPGERPFSGGNRPCYWAGNGTMPYIEQFKDTMLMLFDIDPRELVHYIHGYTPFHYYDKLEIQGNWLFAKVDNAYFGVYFSNGVTFTKSGANTNKEVISRGLKHGIVVKCGSVESYGTYENFKKKISDSNVCYDGSQKLSFNDPQYGELCIKNLNQVYINGEILEYSDKSELQIIKSRIKLLENN